MKRLAGDLFRWLASLQLAVMLILVLAAVLAWATILESQHGRDYSQWVVYKSSWFTALLGLLGINILAATLARFPWRTSRRGFLITHVGLLLLLAGAVLSFVHGIEGRLTFQEGQSAEAILLPERCEFRTLRQGQSGQTPMAFGFQPGPFDWPADKTLDLGELGGVHLAVRRFIRHAETVEEWVAGTERDKPAVKFSLSSPDGKMAIQQWLSADEFGGELNLGPASFRLQEAKAATMLEDFNSPPKEMDKQGVLSMHYDGKRTCVPVSENAGKKVAIGGGVEVEIVRYLANAVPEGEAQFTSKGKKPDNPMLELLVHTPGKEPQRQIAFAKHPLLSFDGMHGWRSPVKFWYHHPGIKIEPGIEFLQTPDGKLYCRAGASGGYQPRGEVKPGDKFDAMSHFTFTLVEHLPRATKKVTFRPAAAADEESAEEAAALMEITAGKTTSEVWLKRNDATYRFQQVESPEGPVAIAFGYEHLPLGFSLKLLDFQRGQNPGGMGDASFASKVQLVDKDHGIDEPRTISMNEPLLHGKFTFYQSGFQELPDGGEASSLTVAYDPGRFLKYLGSLMICAGSALMFVARSETYRKLMSLLTGSIKP
jgi:hypothetical protein